MATSARVRNLYPARTFVVSGPRDAAVATVIAALERLKFRVRTVQGGHPVVLEYGSIGTLLLDVWGLGLLPGRIGKRTWALVDWSEADGLTTFTVAHVSGLGYGYPAREAIARMLAAFDAAGVLVDAGEAISAFDLPPESAGNPKTFREGGYLSAADRWISS